MIVILDNLRSALNVGSIIRTCDALGVKEVYFCGITPGPDHPKVLKTALGAEKNIKSKIITQTIEAVRDLKKKGYQILALEITEKAKVIGSVKLTQKSALIVGNEVSGVSPELLEQTTETVMIPMQGVKESLNVSVAFGIAAYTLIGSKNPCE